MKQVKLFIMLIFAAMLLTNISVFAQHEEHKEHSKHSEAAIDVKAVDENKDGKVLMCPMFCTDLVTDEAARCPECEMKLTEYSVSDAEKHLKDKGYNVKEHDSHKSHDMHDGEHGKGEGSELDIAAIDKNKDGKVYQCPMMCTDHTSDEAGRCSKCEMRLKEYTIKDAEKNLKGDEH
jgi:transcription initiation factor IIE alpha subunit